MRLISHVLMLVAALMMIGGAAMAKPKGPQETLQSIDKKLRPLLKDAKANQEKILDQVRQMLDFKSLCERSLGKHWDTKTAEQQKKFSDTLKALIEKNVVARLKDTKDHIITYEGEDLDGNKATVITVVANGDGPRAVRTEITYKMAKQGGKWVVVDMVTDGVSLVSNYRSQFNKIIEKDGWDKMIEKMEKKLAE